MLSVKQVETIKKGGVEAVLLTNSLMANLKSDMLKKQLAITEEVKKIYNNGNDKILTATQIVKELNIDRLTTTLLNKWFVSRGLGYYKRFNNEKRRTFQPNDNFRKYIAHEGYSLTGATADGVKVKVMYSWTMLDRINNLYRKQIIDFIEKEI